LFVIDPDFLRICFDLEFAEQIAHFLHGTGVAELRQNPFAIARGTIPPRPKPGDELLDFRELFVLDWREMPPPSRLNPGRAS
jgi:hypothetical protein